MDWEGIRAALPGFYSALMPASRIRPPRRVDCACMCAENCRGVLAMIS